MSNVPTRENFEQAYGSGAAPWDIGRPQRALLEIADKVQGKVLDAGCGTGELALELAKRGHEVTGFDFLPQAVEAAQRKAGERGLKANFVVKDALQLADFPEQFDTVIDCGLFHVFSDEDRARYVAGLASVVRPGGRAIVLCFSDAEPPGAGPRRISGQELRDAFVNGWEIEAIDATSFEVRPDLPADVKFSPGGPKAWRAVFKRQSIDS